MPPLMKKLIILALLAVTVQGIAQDHWLGIKGECHLRVPGMSILKMLTGEPESILDLRTSIL